RSRGEKQRQTIQHRCRQEKNCGAQNRESPDKPDGQASGRNRPHPCSWVSRIVITVDNAIESHRRRTRSDHCHRNPNNLPRRWNATCCKHCAQKSKRQREQRVLDLDHFERRADVFNDCGHRFYLCSDSPMLVTLRFHQKSRFGEDTAAYQKAKSIIHSTGRACLIELHSATIKASPENNPLTIPTISKKRTAPPN